MLEYLLHNYDCYQAGWFWNWPTSMMLSNPDQSYWGRLGWRFRGRLADSNREAGKKYGSVWEVLMKWARKTPPSYQAIKNVQIGYYVGICTKLGLALPIKSLTRKSLTKNRNDYLIYVGSASRLSRRWNLSELTHSVMLVFSGVLKRDHSFLTQFST